MNTDAGQDARLVLNSTRSYPTHNLIFMIDIKSDTPGGWYQSCYTKPGNMTSTTHFYAACLLCGTIENVSSSQPKYTLTLGNLTKYTRKLVSDVGGDNVWVYTTDTDLGPFIKLANRIHRLPLSILGGQSVTRRRLPMNLKNILWKEKMNIEY